MIVGEVMKNRRNIIIAFVILLAIGFSAVSTTLVLNGLIGIGENKDDFNVYFSNAIENGDEHKELIIDSTHISFSYDMSLVGESYFLEYEVTNGSKNYDANVKINCFASNDYLMVTNEFDDTKNLLAKEKRRGKITIKVLKAYSGTEEEPTKNFIVSCSIIADAVERTDLGIDVAESDKSYLLGVGTDLRNALFETVIEPYSSSTDFYNQYFEACEVEDSEICQKMEEKYSSYLSEVEEKIKVFEDYPSQNEDVKKDIYKITFHDTLNIPEDATKIWDVSSDGNGSIMAYLSPYTIEFEGEIYELFQLVIEQNGGVVFPSNASGLFSNFPSLAVIEGLQTVDTSGVNNMSFMFYNCEYLSQLDVSSWNTSNVINTSSMFENCHAIKELDLNNWDTHNLVDMSSMFRMRVDAHYVLNSSLQRLMISEWDTSNVTNMQKVFYGNGELEELDISKWNTFKVTDMSYLFSECRSLVIMDFSNWYFGNVTNMRQTFDTCSKLIATVTIIGTKCESYVDMFWSAATKDGAQITVNYSADASDLVDKMLKTTHNSNSNVVKGTAVL